MYSMRAALVDPNAWRPRFTAAMILSGLAVQVEGFGSWLASRRGSG
jgi:hypothetical protein